LANPIKFESCEQETESLLTSELKGFIDRVIVPILVKQYLAERADEKLAGSPMGVAKSTSKTAA
jgi:hypothetical protein